MSEPFSDMLKGGHPNSLRGTPEVVDIVLADRGRLKERFASLADSDELVRMRAGDALEKICREQPGWFGPHIERVLDEVGSIEQPSVQWHVAQVLQHLRDDLSEDQARRATELLRRNLRRSTDWIVLNVTMDVLAEWARDDPQLAEWLVPEVGRLRGDERKSVAKRAAKHLSRLAG